jgi:hypothetical protein
MKNSGYKFIKFTYKKATLPPKIVTSEGDTLVFAKAIYKVNDYERIIEALKGIPGFEILDSSPEEIHIGWLVEKGDITINNNQLKLNCLSMERLKRGKNILKVLGNAIELQSESKEYPDLKGGKVKTRETRLKDPALEEIEQKFLEDHYRDWVDMSLVALNGKTPRECSKTPEGRAMLKEVLKVIENAEERKKEKGQTSYDVNKLRETLGV